MFAPFRHRSVRTAAVNIAPGTVKRRRKIILLRVKTCRKADTLARVAFLPGALRGCSLKCVGSTWPRVIDELHCAGAFERDTFFLPDSNASTRYPNHYTFLSTVFQTVPFAVSLRLHVISNTNTAVCLNN